MVTSQQFARELISQAQVLELKIVFRSCKDKDFKVNKECKDLDQVSKRLHMRYRNFFNINKAEQQPLHQLTNHAIELKPSSEPLYIQTYNMLPAELKALDKYLTKALTKR